MDDSPRRRTSPLVWILRLSTVVMVFAGGVEWYRKNRTTDEQDELLRFVQFTVPNYLGDVADAEARIDRLSATPGISATEARARLVDDVMPQLIRARKRAVSVKAQAPSVRALNDEYQAALERLMEVERAAVRAIDDPSISPEVANRQVRDRRHEADGAFRQWMDDVRDRCKKAGLHVDAQPEKK